MCAKISCVCVWVYVCARASEARGVRGARARRAGPARDGGGTLYTREHFEAVRERLNDGGLFCQWLPMYQLDDDMLRVIIHTFGLVFPDARAVMHDINLNYPALAPEPEEENFDASRD